MKVDGRGSGSFLQFKLLLWKNFLLKKRAWVSSLSEILLPVLGCLILALIRSVVYPSNVKENLNLGSNISLAEGVGGDKEAVALFISAIACGARNSRGDISTAPVTFAVAADEKLAFERENIALKFRQEWAILAEAVGHLNCSDKPLACYIPGNEYFPECRNAHEYTVNLTTRVSRKYFVRTFDSELALLNYVNSDDYATSDDENPPILFGVSIKEGGPNWKYTIHGNFSALPLTTRTINRFSLGFDDKSWRQYVEQGFMIMQYFIDNFILNNELDNHRIRFVPFPTAAYKIDEFSSGVSKVFGLFLILCMMWPFSRLVRNIVEEKEKRIKEGMKMMGLRSAPFWLSWSLTYLVIFILIALICAGMMANGVFQYSDFSIIFLILVLFGFSLITLGCLVSSLFSRAKTAGTISPFVLLGLWLPYIAVRGDDVKLNTLNTAMLASPVAFTLATGRALSYESSFEGITWKNINEDLGNFTVTMALIMLIIDTFIYGLLSWYLDKVVPGDYGTSLPFYFCCLPEYWCSNHNKGISKSKRNSIDDQKKLIDNIHQEEDSHIQPVSESLRNTPGVNILKLRKKFKENVAVDCLNLNIYEGQIFVLLGHNGAGKTTTINMLTGMMPTTAGSAYLYGYSINRELSSIRKFMGVCPQHDILFPTLTVREHLVLFARLKGVSNENTNATVKQSIAEIQLESCTNQMAGTLSGGQKRRLSLAISLIGDSKVVFLDEPTSGVDPASRRAIWDLLNIKKAGRVIILTTHFMDEADILGDRIAILHKGKLRCCGTSLFLKKIFGVGYNITISKADAGVNSVGLSSLVREYVPGVNLLSDSGTELSMQLPFTSSAKFPDMLEALENRGKDLGCVNFGLSVTTLEEVFIRVAHMEEDPNEYKKTRQSIQKLSSTHRMHSTKIALLESAKDNYSFCRHFKAMLLKRWAVAKRDRKLQCCQFLVPILILLFGLLLVNNPPTFTPPKLKLSPTMFPQPLPVPYNGRYMNEETLLNTTLSHTGADLFPFRDVNGTIQEINSLENFSRDLLENRFKFSNTMYGAFYYDKIEEFDVKRYNIYTNSSARHGFPAFFNQLTSGLYQLQNTTEKRSITVSTDPFPFTKRELKLGDSFAGIFTSIIVALAFSFIPSAYVVFVVREREIKAKHIQIISGVSIDAYWISNYFFDMVSFCIPGGIGALMIYAFHQDAFIGPNFVVLCLAIFLYGAAVIPFTYLCSFFFKSASTAQNVMILLYIMGGVILLLTSNVLYQIDSTKPYADTFRFFFRLIPNFCLGDTVFYLSVLELLSVLSFNAPGRWDLLISGWDLIFLGIEAPIFFIAVLVMERLLLNNIISLDCTKPNPALENQGLGIVEDSDIEQEKHSIVNGEKKDDMIALHGLRKVFPQKVAVNDLWFTVPIGQCFGFLGVNGAGKSTTLKMITGDEYPTQGNAFIAGISAIEQPAQVRRLIGYCPQFDALHTLMTAEETLALYARIRGIPEKNIAPMVQYLCERLTLDQDDQHKRPAGTYSGGNKRKLSVAIALIGDPKCVFLDEPSTGMDPVSRRFMWDFISETMTSRAVILTTHSMEECEALCSRLSILVHGRLRCIGSSQHLKNRYGTGFEFLLSCKGSHVEKVRKWVQSTFNSAQEMECYGGNMKYKLGRQSMVLSQIFSLIEGNRENLGITDYSVGQTTLEQIFIRFARDGDKEEEKKIIQIQHKEDNNYDRM